MNYQPIQQASNLKAFGTLSQNLRGRRKIKRQEYIIESNVDKNEVAKIVDTIRNKYPNELKEYIYVYDIGSLRKGMYIYYISFDLTKIHGGIIINLNKDTDSKIYLITLRSTYEKIYWKFKVNQHHIFTLDTTNKVKNKDLVRECLTSYCNKMNIDINI